MCCTGYCKYERPSVGMASDGSCTRPDDPPCLREDVSCDRVEIKREEVVDGVDSVQQD